MTDVAGSAGCILPESHQPAVIGQADDPEILRMVKEALPVIGMDDGLAPSKTTSPAATAVTALRIVNLVAVRM